MRAAAVALAIAACTGNKGPPLFPPDYAATYTQVRPCRASPDHGLDNVLVFTDPSATGPYMMRNAPFPIGAVVLKEEHDPDDLNCTGPITSWSVMVKLADGAAPPELDWKWQDVEADRQVRTNNEPRCYGCHTNCGVAPCGYAGTCSVP